MQVKERFYGWRVAWSAFAVAVLAWGTGFYGPSVYLETIHATRGWPIAGIASAITVHFAVSAIVIAYLPDLHARFGIARTTAFGAAMTAVGLLGWAHAAAPWQLFVATLPSALGWAATSGAAVNAIVSPWFDRDRPKAIGLAFNGASVGGVVFVPLWIFMIDAIGFPAAAAAIGGVTVVVVVGLASTTLRATPAKLGVYPDGAAAAPEAAARPQPTTTRARLFKDVRFLTISIAFALGLFAQIGLLSHLVVRLTPEVGSAAAGGMVSLATVFAVVGRTLLGWLIGDRDRRVAAALNFTVQVAGAILLAFGSGWPALALGCVLFGLGIGNLVSLPPLIVQKEFSRADAPVAVALIVAVNQAAFAFAPAMFGLIRDHANDYAAAFLLAAAAQVCAAGVVLVGRRRA